MTSLQPGELGKLIFIFTIAAHMTEIQDHITEWRGLVSVGLHTLVMMGAVVLSSGDTGMAIQYLMIAVIMLFSAGLPLKWLGIAAGVGIASIPILWNYVLKDYQKTRILVLFDPSIDVEQSRQATSGKIAIGSGQFPGQGAWKDIKAKLSGLPPLEQVKAVNVLINRWPYRTDMDVWGVMDYWETPAEFFQKSGDCEDFAIAKYFALRDLGFPASQMRIVVLKDTLRNLDHAVTAVYLDGDAWILDNLSNAVLSHKRLSHYRPQFSVNEEYRWAHLTPSAPKKTGR